MPLTRTMLEGFRNGRLVRVAIIASARVFPIPGKRVSASASATLMSIHASAFSCACPMDSSSRFGRFGAIAMATMRFSLAEFADCRLDLGLGFATASAISSRSTMALARSSCSMCQDPVPSYPSPRCVQKHACGSAAVAGIFCIGRSHKHDDS